MPAALNDLNFSQSMQKSQSSQLHITWTWFKNFRPSKRPLAPSPLLKDRPFPKWSCFHSFNSGANVPQ